MYVILSFLTGCQGYYGSRMQANQPSDAIVPAHAWAPRGLPMFEGETGRVATWSDLMEGVAWADVVVLGEEHDDAVAHRYQLAVVEEMLATWPKTAVALEMIERDEQDALDAYLSGEQDQESFLASITSSEKGRETFTAFYLPIVDSAGESHAPVVGANAPRRHARMARLEGYESLRALEQEEKKLFDIPPHLDDGAYRDAIEKLMSEHEMGVSHEDVDAVLRAQQLWDRTMALSVLRALDAGMTKVVLLVGRFHGDFARGTVAQLRHDRPLLKILYVTTISEDVRALQPDDQDRADLVVYTGGVSTAKEPVDPVDTVPEETSAH
jgi:uncharacterized iron-regulated protein